MSWNVELFMSLLLAALVVFLVVGLLVKRSGGWKEWGAVLVLVVFAGGGFALSQTGDNAIERQADHVSSVDEARKFFIGTWTYAEPLAADSQILMWEKWVVKPDGTMDIYRAPPDAEDWGTPQRVSYEIFTGKFVNTGRRYFAIRGSDPLERAVIDANNSLALSKLDFPPVAMRRGDRFPFSK